MTAADLPRVEIIGAPDPYNGRHITATADQPLASGQAVILQATSRGVEWDARATRPDGRHDRAWFLDVDWHTVRRIPYVTPEATIDGEVVETGRRELEGGDDGR